MTREPLPDIINLESLRKVVDMETEESKHVQNKIDMLLDSDLSLYNISKESGVPYTTVRRLSSGRNYDDARFRTIKALYGYATEKEIEI